MRVLISLAISMAALAGCAAPQPPAAGPLTGAWVATAAERNGAPARDVVGHVLTFAGSDFTIAGADGAQIWAGTWSSDASATPAEIDFRIDEGAGAGQEWLGVWRLDGAALRIADNAPDPSRPRPTAFAAPAGSGVVLATFERPAGG